VDHDGLGALRCNIISKFGEYHIQSLLKAEESPGSTGRDAGKNPVSASSRIAPQRRYRSLGSKGEKVG